MKNLLVATMIAVYLMALMPTGIASAQVTTGASLSFNPPGGNIPRGENFTVSIIVNTGGQDSAAADVTVKYETSKLEFVSGTYPDSTTFYPNNRVIYPISANSGKIGMARTVSTPASGAISYTNGSGTFAVLTFKTKSTVALGDTTTLSFEYTPGATSDFTNVANSATPVADMLGTSTLPTATYTVAAGTTPVPTPTPTPTPLPNSGPEEMIWGAITLMAMSMTWFVYRKATIPQLSSESYSSSAPQVALPIMNYSIEKPVSGLNDTNQT